MVHRLMQMVPNLRWLVSWLVPVRHCPDVWQSDGERIYAARWVGWLWLGRPKRMRWVEVG